MTTDQEIKDRLFRLWAFEVAKQMNIADEVIISMGYSGLKDLHDFKTISEIKSLMLKDGIELSEINKIIFGG